MFEEEQIKKCYETFKPYFKKSIFLKNEDYHKFIIERAKENDKFKIKISDNGLGIDLVQYGKDLFGLYKRFNIEQEGKGLGLYMVKKQIEAINGEIKIESELNKGTTFLITI